MESETTTVLWCMRPEICKESAELLKRLAEMRIKHRFIPLGTGAVVLKHGQKYISGLDNIRSFLEEQKTPA